MAPNLSSTQKDRIQTLIEQGLADEAIATVENVHVTTVWRIRQLVRTFGTHSRPDEACHKRGPNPTITPDMRFALLDYLLENPWAYQDELMDILYDQFEVVISQPVVSRTLAAMKVSRKDMRREASERAGMCRNKYMAELSQFLAHQLVFIDDRKRGWSPLGTVPGVKRPTKRSERWRILPAYTIDGIIASHIHQGSTAHAHLEYFLKHQVLPRCNPFPRPKSVLIVDNLPEHYSAETQRLCREAGVIILYLPPYSADYNPIEEFFSVIKSWMKRHFQYLEEGVTFEDFLQMAVDQKSRSGDARAHFLHAGISVN